ncbi:fasciclin domain protein [Toxoplasma gondii TgCatPRC2]|uniref:Fasciclin domain protein n=5 Tax=Toxoplasma gondii TaxID=5811 RepID=B6KRA4_TOXGV|nr:hypothetical protein TGME49_306050 [Toxoplasma gondii ME49]ESS28994.1 fasciclin domain protein [Toxoplasma gondii VEG]KYF44722.1 fasciclin domain protein [Toxoplasma gondii ARI]KYK64648.1 fasciclin domain protein [Toxoplasma gondii TgCatPRC2]PIL97122.1 fasciclin domain protein [Toxoplasma gondii COUG]EPT27437.1 hypothetical protein TGME49_306050 [Toxoplasma gondii ME49]|eukprot:XP_002370377.1 hypothetical protein TGME49_306050 [Toxoplasma gondii ME49]
MARRLAAAFCAVVLAGSAFSFESAEGLPKSIVDIIKTNPKLSAAREWAEESGILQKVDLSHYGDKVTIVLPSNRAFKELQANHPTWKAQLVSNSEDVETLILFASTDHSVTPEEIKAGKYEDTDSLVSILSEYSSISRSGRLCVSDYTRALPCDDPDSLPCCAKVDLRNVLEAEDGYIYLIDQVLLPQELIDKLED